MKILFLAEFPENIEKYLALYVPEVKIITEQEIVADTPYTPRFHKAGYTAYLTERAGNLIKSYRLKRNLAIVLDQRHPTAIDKIPADKTVRIVENLTPRRLSNAVSYKADITIIENDLTPEFFSDLFVDKSLV